MTYYADTFNRADTPAGSGLGRTSTGDVLWETVTGSFRIASQRAAAAAVSPVPIAVLPEVGLNADATLAGYGGAALYLRVVDAANWLRARCRYYPVTSSYSYSYTEYYWQGTRYTNGQANGSVSATTTSSSPPPASAFGVYSPDQVLGVSLQGSSPRTGTSSSTSYYWSAVLDQCVNGTVTQLAETARATSRAALRAVLTGSAVTVSYGTTSASATLSGQLAPGRRGIGYAPSESHEGVLDDFTLDTLNTPPTAAQLAGPADRESIDRAAPQRLRWQFADPDSGDTQSKFDLRHKPEGATVWTTITVATPQTYYDAPAGAFPLGDHEWQVRTYDAQGQEAPWSASGFFTAADAPAAPTITDPINNGNVPAAFRLAWSHPTQDAYQVRRLLDAAGAPGELVEDTGTLPDPAARSHGLSFPVNNRLEHLQVRVFDAGLWSPWASVRVQVAYTPPPVPVVALQAVSTQGITDLDALLVRITNPAPLPGQPAVVFNDVELREGPAAPWVRVMTLLAPSTPWVYPWPIHDLPYEARVTAVGDNDTTSTSPSTG